MKEIEMVAGGKAAQTTTSAWDRFVAWLDSWLSNSSGGATSQPATIQPPSDDALARMLDACRESGGGFEYQQSTGGGSLLMRLFRADGAVTTIRIVCD
jgi:hypothetical protein